jgi:hypothetical protein
MCILLRSNWLDGLAWLIDFVIVSVGLAVLFAIFSIPFWAYYATTAEKVEQQFEGLQPLHT